MIKDPQVVDEATNDEQSLGTLRGTPHEVVLPNISMPGVNGLEVIPRVRVLNELSAALVLPMHDEAQMATHVLKIGAAGYATEDSDPTLLLTVVRRVAGGERCIDPDLTDRMVFEVGLTDSCPPHALLSEYELSVLERLVQGANVNRITWQLMVSNKTVSTREARLMQKLNAHLVADLVCYTMKYRLL